jgi:hypothetical protein
LDCVRQRIATSENVEPVTRTACAAWRRTPSSAAAATSRPTAPATAPYEDDGATLDDLREAVDTYEDTERTARRVFGGAHPFTGELAEFLREARAVLRARETPSPPGQA